MPYEKEKSKHDEQTLADLSSARRRLQALYQLAQKKNDLFFSRLRHNKHLVNRA